MKNALVWVDIPVLDLDRAISFYTAVIGSAVVKQDYPGMSIGLFPHEGESASGCLYLSDTVKPSDQGPLIYLNCDGRLDEAVAAVEANGGKVLMPKHSIGPHGFRAILLDPDGNRVALHST
jgi:predicted enzyme related to lactoylglutathione lyase